MPHHVLLAALLLTHFFEVKNSELREDGSLELREDGATELRE